MDASALFQERGLGETRLLPVVTLPDDSDAGDLAVSLAEVLLDCGLTAIEVTLRTENALRAMEQIASKVPQMCLGAGSLRQPEQVASIKRAGASFAVSPGATDALIDAAEAAALPMVPGAETASEVLRLYARGYTLQKFFPAEVAGGVNRLRALSAPLPEVRFCPTGGVSPANIGDYLALGSVACVGGSWFVPVASISQRDFDGIATLTREALALTGAPAK